MWRCGTLGQHLDIAKEQAHDLLCFGREGMGHASPKHICVYVMRFVLDDRLADTPDVISTRSNDMVAAHRLAARDADDNDKKTIA